MSCRITKELICGQLIASYKVFEVGVKLVLSRCTVQNWGLLLRNGVVDLFELLNLLFEFAC